MGRLKEVLYGPIDPYFPFVWYKEIVKFVLCITIVDIWFYWTHRVLHFPVFYKAIHKLHHRFKAPTAVACMFAPPLEFGFGNLLGVSLGPVLANALGATAMIWIIT